MFTALQAVASPLGHSTARVCGPSRADDGIRTRDPNLGKVVRYQLRHVRMPRWRPSCRLRSPWCDENTNGLRRRCTNRLVTVCSLRSGGGPDRPRTPAGSGRTMRSGRRGVRSAGRCPPDDHWARPVRSPCVPEGVARAAECAPRNATRPGGSRAGLAVSPPRADRVSVPPRNGPRMRERSRSRGSVEERPVHTGKVAGSNPAGTTVGGAQATRPALLFSRPLAPTRSFSGSTGFFFASARDRDCAPNRAAAGQSPAAARSRAAIVRMVARRDSGSSTSTGASNVES